MSDLTPGSRRIYRIVCWASGITVLLSIAYGVISTILSGSTQVVGASLVTTEFPLPWFAKPISYLSFGCVSFFYTALKLWEDQIAKWSQATLLSLQLLAILVAFGSAYEILYNFMLWGSIFTSQLVSNAVTNPNIIVPDPAPWNPDPSNLVFATKMFLALFVISAYSVHFLRKVR